MRAGAVGQCGSSHRGARTSRSTLCPEPPLSTGILVQTQHRYSSAVLTWTHPRSSPPSLLSFTRKGFSPAIPLSCCGHMWLVCPQTCRSFSLRIKGTKPPSVLPDGYNSCQVLPNMLLLKYATCVRNCTNKTNI